MMSHISSPEISQYHHFVPRFILRNFAHPFQPPIAPSKGSGKRNKRKKRDGHRPGESMLNVIKLDGATAQIVETPVAKTLGIVDMYRDLRGAANQNHLEKELSKLESRAAMVISKMRKAFEAGDKDVWITRAERDILRKFLFIMKYRSSGFHKRYFHHDAEHYSENDKDRLLEYMRKKGYEKPVDVWFDNIKAMLELKMDPQMEWMVWLREHVYPDDAMWFIAHCQMMYLALCTPSGSVDEFLLAENAYGIHEGPVSCYVDPKTMKMTEGSYTEFHVFAPVSPRLMLVLRSFLLPVPEEDAHEETRVWRQSLFEQNAAQHKDPLRVRSILEDLPIRKARNSYTKIVDGKVVPLEGEDGSLRADHKFCFRFFPISVDHTNRINFIMLEHAYHISTIVCKSQPAAFRTLREYLTMPCELHGSAFKVIDDPDDDQRMSFLKKLERLVGDLGSKGMSTYQTRIKECDDKLGMLGQMLGKSHLSAQDDSTDFRQLYGKLGGTLITLPKDMDQAAKMLNMRIKIDVWSKGLSNRQREDIREKLGTIFCQLPARRVWLYLKRVRFMLRTGTSKTGEVVDASQLAPFRKGEDAEDTIVDASHLIRTSRLGHLMWFAAINELHQRKIVGPAGSISKCGIVELEEQARLFKDGAQTMNLYRAYSTPLYTDEEKLEIVTRCFVREEFGKSFRANEAVPDRQALERVLFDTIYPCPGGGT